MKNKSATQGSHYRDTKSPHKETAKPTKSADKDVAKSADKDVAKSTKSADKDVAKSLPKKALAKRTPIKLRASTGKCVANRTRDKSPKALVSSLTHKAISGPTEKIKSSGRMPASAKPRIVTQRMSGEDGATVGTNTTQKTSSRAGINTKSSKHEKGRNRRKTLKQSGGNSFMDLWALASFGKREASLNASIKVNILYEKFSPSKSSRTSPKKSENGAQRTKPDENVTDTVSVKGNITEARNTIRLHKKKHKESVKKHSPGTDEDYLSSSEPNKSSGKNERKRTVFKSKQSDGSCRKRKSPGYKIFKEESSGKVRKVDKKSSTKPKSRLGKGSKKVLPPGHQLCNIIEKCPRQASLVAKAMIAMGQEEETVPDLAARTTVYDWMELRSLTQSETRRIQWFNGFGNIFQGKQRTCDSQQLSKDDGTSAGGVDGETRSDCQAAVEESESLHNTLLRTLHQIGDSRLLKEYLRAQKEDFPGHVDVESCSTPEESLPAVPNPNKLVVAPSANEKADQEVDKPEKPFNCSPVKPQPCRAATPLPQFPVTQRTSSFIHHPVAQPIYPQTHAQSHPQPIYPQTHAQPHPQPIKVTPYTPSPTYIYQYAMDRPQGALYAPPSPSPIAYGVGSNEVAHRDYPSTYTLSHMGSLSLGRRGVHPYSPAQYNTSLHLPMQQLGFNYSAYYPTPIQALPQQNMVAMPMHQQYPLVAAPVLTQRQMPADMSQLESYQNEYPPYPSLPNMGPDSSCMPPPTLPPPPPAHRPPPPPLRQPPMSHHSMPPVSPMESLRSMNPASVQSIARSPALDFAASYIHHQSSPGQQLPVFASCISHQQLTRDHPINPPFRYSVTCSGLNKSFSPCKKEHDDSPSFDCDLISKNSMCNNDCLPRSLSSSRTNSEGSDISDLLHSAHTTMYQIDSLNSMDNIRDFHHTQAPAAELTVGNCSASKLSLLGHSSFSTSYSVSSILDMPACKVKSEPEAKVCAVSHLSNVFNSKEPQSVFVAASAGSSGGLHSKDTTPNNIHHKNDTTPNNIHHMNDTAPNNIHHKNDTAPNNIHHKNDTAPNNIHHKNDTTPNNIHHKNDTAPNNIHHKNDTAPNNIHHKNDTAPNNIHHKNDTAANNIHHKNGEKHTSLMTVKTEEKCQQQYSAGIIIIDDTDGSSDDEPLARLVKAKSSQDAESLASETAAPDLHTNVSSLSKAKISSSHIPTQQQNTVVKHKDKQQNTVVKHKDKDKVMDQTKPADFKKEKKQISVKLQASSKCGILKSQQESSPSDNLVKQESLPTDHLVKVQLSPTDEENKSHADKEPKNKSLADKEPKSKSLADKEPKNKSIAKRATLAGSYKSKKAPQKMKNQPVWPQTPMPVNSNHGWSWLGQGHMKPIPKLSPGKEEPIRIRKSYGSMKHTSGEIVSVRDCVILHSEGDGSIPFVAKVSALWENINGEMMFSMLWYYQPEHTAVGREPDDGDQELFASKHREENSVACIDDKCFVLMYNEYCRLEAEGARHEQGVSLPRWRTLMPDITDDDKKLCRPLPPPNTCADNIWFCRYDYDMRKKVVKKPKHKKSNLRYRAPCKPV